MAIASSTRTEHWRDRFRARTDQHRSVQEVDASATDEPTRQALAPSLAVFQLGESGSGEHLLSAARRAGADAAYVEALALFVREEQEHARLLAAALDALRWPQRSHHWSDGVFVLIRRAHSLRTEVLVLMVAEVVALSYYSSLRDGASSTSLGDVFARIHDDEVVHVDFHCETLPVHLCTLPSPLHAIARLLWNVLVTGASVAVASDHGPALRAAGTTRRRFLVRVWRDRSRISSRLFARPTERRASGRARSGPASP